MDQFWSLHSALLIHLVRIWRYNTQYITIWNANIPLKIKVFLWLLKQDKILTKSNLLQKGWHGNPNCLFCGALETADHLFAQCPFTTAIWSWIARHNNFTYNCNSINDLWLIDSCIPLKDVLLVELLRVATLWNIWLARNKLCFNDSAMPSLANIGSSIISLASYWCKIRNDDSYFKLTLILPMDVSNLTQVGTLITLSGSNTQGQANSQTLEDELGSARMDLSHYLRNRVESNDSGSDNYLPSSDDYMSCSSDSGSGSFFF